MPEDDDALLDNELDDSDDIVLENEAMDNVKDTDQKEYQKLEIRRKLEDVLEEKRLKKQLEDSDDLD